MRKLICLCIIGIVVLSFLILKEYQPVYESNKEVSAIEQEVFKEEENGEKSYSYTNLKNINKDAVGWIKVPNTNIDYPIMQGSTYLNKDSYGNYSGIGSIFILNESDSNLEDARTLIYGHNIYYDVMFGELKKYYRDSNFKDSHNTFYVYSGNTKKTIKIFSIFGCDESDEIITNYKNRKLEGYDDMVKSLYNRDQYQKERLDLETCLGKQVFTLTTCKGEAGSTERLLVNGVVVKEEFLRR